MLIDGMERERKMKYTTKKLESMKTISEGHFDNLKIDTGETRVWLSRMTIEDGMPYNNQVTIEKLVNGCWVISEQYQG